MTRAERNTALIACPCCDGYRARIAYLESELGLIRDAESVNALRRGLGVTPAEAEVLTAMSEAHPRPMQAWALESRLPIHHRDADHSGVLRVHISRIRKQFGRESIVTLSGPGDALYGLSHNMAARVFAVVSIYGRVA